MVYMPRNEIQSHADISRIILVCKLPLKSVMLRLGLGLVIGSFTSKILVPRYQQNAATKNVHDEN